MLTVVLYHPTEEDMADSILPVLGWRGAFPCHLVDCCAHVCIDTRGLAHAIFICCHEYVYRYACAFLGCNYLKSRAYWLTPHPQLMRHRYVNEYCNVPFRGQHAFENEKGSHPARGSLRLLSL